MSFIITNKLLPQHTEQLHQLYQQQWWSNKRTLSDVEAILKHSSLVFGMLDAEKNLIGFGRVLTDYAYKALIMDIIIAAPYRKRGLSTELMQNILTHESLKKVTHFDLSCRPDMIPLYEKFGFIRYPEDHLWMRKNVEK